MVLIFWLRPIHLPSHASDFSKERSESPAQCLISFVSHSDYKTVSPYWVLPVYVELIRAVWADDGDRPLLF
jgi:hypothetical protein